MTQQRDKRAARRPLARASSVKRGGALWPLALLGFASGCGHPATESECREILRKAAELELVQRLEGSAELLQKELGEIEASMQEPMMEKCVGKRITEGALACVRAAKSSEELFSECLK